MRSVRQDYSTISMNILGDALSIVNPYLTYSRRQKRSLLIRFLPVNTPDDVPHSPQDLMEQIETFNIQTELGECKLHAASTWKDRLPVWYRRLWLRYVANLWTRQYSFHSVSAIEKELLSMYQDGLVSMARRKDQVLYWRARRR